MVRFLLIVTLLPCLLLLPGATVEAQDRPTVDVGMVLDGPWERNEEILGLLRDEITRVNQADFDIRFPETMLWVGENSPESIRPLVDRLLADGSTDLVIAVGPLAAMDVARRRDLPKAVIAPFILDSAAQGIPRTPRGTSGVPNLSYLEFPETIQQDLAQFRKIVDFGKLAFLVNQSLLGAVDGMKVRVEEQLALLGIDVQVVAVGGSAAEALGALEADVDAVYIVPLIELDPGEFDSLIGGLTERRLPSFSFLGREDVERGVLAGLTADAIFPRYARRVALNTQRILLGEPASELPVALSRNEELSLNMSTARAIGARPSFEVLTEAVIIDPSSTPPERQIGLLDALQEAARVNRDLLARKAEVRAGEGRVGSAKAELLPQIDASLTGVWIDEDRAAASFGSTAERTVTGTVGMSQILWSEPARANLGIQRSLQSGRRSNERTTQLDVALEAGKAYLQLLRAKTQERIRREDLRLTRSNLELARIRRSLGVSGPAEVFRWESQLAQAKAASIEANAQRNLAEIELNRVLHRPLEQAFATREVGLDEPGLPAIGRLDRYISDPWSFRTLRTYLTKRALENSPELRQLDAAIAAQERTRTSSRRRFYSPTLALRGELSREFDASGAGTEGLTIPGFDLPEADETDWSLALNLSLPIFEGGARRADFSRSSLELEQLRLERAALVERIEQRIRSAAHLAGSSYAAIALSRQSSEAAKSNLELVADAYARGAVQIIDLIDAQNAALTAEQAAADSVHDFLLDLFEVERALGAFTFLATPEEVRLGYDALDAYFEAEGGGGN